MHITIETVRDTLRTGLGHDSFTAGFVKSVIEDPDIPAAIHLGAFNDLQVAAPAEGTAHAGAGRIFRVAHRSLHVLISLHSTVTAVRVSNHSCPTCSK